jgi:hypothetical protein
MHKRNYAVTWTHLANRTVSISILSEDVNLSLILCLLCYLFGCACDFIYFTF